MAGTLIEAPMRTATNPHLRFATIGECMLELHYEDAGGIVLSFGGDTFNTAAYARRLGDGLGDFVDYITAIGDDPFSAEMAAFWSAQGVGHSHVLRRAGKRPGLYFIKLDANGERRFYYWRGEAAVRDCFETEGSDELLASLGGFTHIYLSGITLAVLRPASRERLLSRLEQLARSGTTIVFDCNHRPLLWESPQTAGTFAARMARMATHLLLTVEELAVFGVAPAAEAGAAYFSAWPDLDVVIKDGERPCTLVHGGRTTVVPGVHVEHVVDTTAAGDSFSAAYMLGRALGLDPQESARRAHVVAAAVVQYHGAIIPKDATPAVFAAELAAQRAAAD